MNAEWDLAHRLRERYENKMYADLDAESKEMEREIERARWWAASRFDTDRRDVNDTPHNFRRSRDASWHPKYGFHEPGEAELLFETEHALTSGLAFDVGGLTLMRAHLVVTRSTPRDKGPGWYLALRADPYSLDGRALWWCFAADDTVRPEAAQEAVGKLFSLWGNGYLEGSIGEIALDWLWPDEGVGDPAAAVDAPAQTRG